MQFSIPQVVRHKETGDLLIAVERYGKTQHHGAGYRCSPIDNRYTTRGYSDDELEAAPPRKPGAFDYKTEIVPRAQGAAAVLIGAVATLRVSRMTLPVSP